MTPDRPNDGLWLPSLRDHAQAWLIRTNGLPRLPRENPAGKPGASSAPATTPMSAYADLIFAFGLARLDRADEARELLARGYRELDPAGEVHSVLCEGYCYRIGRAIWGMPLAGRLYKDIRERIGRLQPRTRFAVDRVRALSRILEPDARVDPYRSDLTNMAAAGANLEDAADADDLRARIEAVRAARANGPGGRQWQIDLVWEALGQALWAGHDFAVEVLTETLPAYDRDVPDMGIPGRTDLLSRALAVALRHGRRDFFLPLAARAHELLRQLTDADFVRYRDALEQCVRGYHEFGLRGELEDLLDDVTDRIASGTTRAAADRGKQSEFTYCLLAVAVGRYLLGQTAAARAILVEAEPYLFTLDGHASMKTLLACAYAVAVARAPNRGVVHRRTYELFDRLEGIDDGLGGEHAFSLPRIRILEAVVLAVTEPPTAGPDPVIQVYPTL